jgi:hypothetical protein
MKWGDAKPFVFENLDCRDYDERALFQFPESRAGETALRIAHGPQAPNRWDISLPDLSSRLSAVPIVEIGAPDEGSAQDGHAQAFRRPAAQCRAEGAWNSSPFTWIRSLQAAAGGGEAVDRLALATGRKINRQLVVRRLRGSACDRLAVCSSPNS